MCAISRVTNQQNAKSWPGLLPTSNMLCCYSEKLPLMRVMNLSVAYRGKEVKRQLYVVEGQGSSLYGRDDHGTLSSRGGSDCKSEGTRSQMLETMRELKEKVKELFRAGTGPMKGPAAYVDLKAKVNSKVFKPRSLQFTFRDKLAAELHPTCQEGILSPVSNRDWAALVGPVLKPDGSLRICRDHKVTLNF